LHPGTHRQAGPSGAQSSSATQFREQNSLFSLQPLLVAPSVSNSHSTCPTHELPPPHETVVPLPHGVPGATPEEHDDIAMKSEAQVTATPLIHRASTDRC
jgi:hypothetical protein